MKEKWMRDWVLAWILCGLGVLTFFMTLLLVLADNDQERYLAKLEACKSAPDIATCINLTTMGGN